jgi:hypothetical protein
MPNQAKRHPHLVLAVRRKISTAASVEFRSRRDRTTTVVVGRSTPSRLLPYPNPCLRPAGAVVSLGTGTCWLVWCRFRSECALW